MMAIVQGPMYGSSTSIVCTPGCNIWQQHPSPLPHKVSSTAALIHDARSINMHITQQAKERAVFARVDWHLDHTCIITTWG
jgi:hypothetical protein